MLAMAGKTANFSCANVGVEDGPGGEDAEALDAVVSSGVAIAVVAFVHAGAAADTAVAVGASATALTGVSLPSEGAVSFGWMLRTKPTSCLSSSKME